ncbi:MAG: AbrB/MazE/SpoVT family DNA-binding domain-containing protein [Actinobacteria bacterium]|nr:MAG: AbrB/MazE/SpoVT family DNA-binding domain-containing protein [Actinomycetota bacterium]
MVTKVQKWGNSQGLRLGKDLLSEAGIGIGDEVEVLFRDGEIIITPVHRVRGRLSLEELVREIPADWKAEEVDWGRPRGKEVW